MTIGREKKEYNDLFYVCSLIEYTARKTKNYRRVVVNAIGEEGLQHLYELADVYHSDNIDKVSDELIEKYHISIGHFDNIAQARYTIPTHWDIGKVYQRLIINICQNTNIAPINALIEVYNSWIADKIDDYNSSMYYENPGYLYASYQKGEPL